MTYLLLFAEFFKIGLFSVGGGLATLPFLYELAEKYHWFTKEMVSNMLAVSEATPGPIGVNMATYAGFDAGGVVGSIVATVGLVTPSVIIILLIAKAMTTFSENRFVKSAFSALRPAAVAIISIACFEVLQSSVLHVSAFTQTWKLSTLFTWQTLLLFAVLLGIIRVFKKLHPIFVILLAAAAGIVLGL